MQEHNYIDREDVLHESTPNHTEHTILRWMSAGSYHSLGWNKKYPTIQILTVIVLLKGAEIQMPPQYGTFREAQRIQQQSEALQLELGTEPGDRQNLPLTTATPQILVE